MTAADALEILKMAMGILGLLATVALVVASAIMLWIDGANAGNDDEGDEAHPKGDRPSGTSAGSAGATAPSREETNNG